jgi:Prokaryotic N-terminal methylation motif
MTRLTNVKSENGYSLVELMVAISAGMVVLFAVTSFIMIGLRHSSRISDSVDATQQGRIVLYQVMDELHSACIAPALAPVQAASDATSLRLIHQRGSAVAPTPVLSVVSLNEGTLSESVYPLSSESEGWKFSSTASSSGTLSTGISPSGSNPGIFSYYAYSGGQVSPTPLPTPLSQEDAEQTVQVRVALTAAPREVSVADESTAVSVQDTALLRFSPAPYSESANNLPCQ